MIVNSSGVFDWFSILCFEHQFPAFSLFILWSCFCFCNHPFFPYSGNLKVKKPSHGQWWTTNWSDMFMHGKAWRLIKLFNWLLRVVSCSFQVCKNYTRAYLHCLVTKDAMGSQLLSYHNLSYMMRVTALLAWKWHVLLITYSSFRFMNNYYVYVALSVPATILW